jgi:hypothetical protein
MQIMESKKPNWYFLNVRNQIEILNKHKKPNV